MKPFKVLSRKQLIDSPFCPIEKQIVELPSGKTTEWYINLNEGAVLVMPILKKGEILLQRNYKHGSGEVVTEFCAGMIDKGETPLKAAIRELKEETGFTASKFEEVRALFSNPTGSKMQYHYVVALEAKKFAEPQLEEAEQIEIFTVPNIEAAKKLLLNSETKTTAGSVAGIFILENFLTSTA